MAPGEEPAVEAKQYLVYVDEDALEGVAYSMNWSSSTGESCDNLPLHHLSGNSGPLMHRYLLLKENSFPLQIRLVLDMSPEDGPPMWTIPATDVSDSVPIQSDFSDHIAGSIDLTQMFKNWQRGLMDTEFQASRSQSSLFEERSRARQEEEARQASRQAMLAGLSPSPPSPAPTASSSHLPPTSPSQTLSRTRDDDELLSAAPVSTSRPSRSSPPSPSERTGQQQPASGSRLTLEEVQQDFLSKLESMKDYMQQDLKPILVESIKEHFQQELQSSLESMKEYLQKEIETQRDTIPDLAQIALHEALERQKQELPRPEATGSAAPPAEDRRVAELQDQFSKLSQDIQALKTELATTLHDQAQHGEDIDSEIRCLQESLAHLKATTQQDVQALRDRVSDLCSRQTDGGSTDQIKALVDPLKDEVSKLRASMEQLEQSRQEPPRESGQVVGQVAEDLATLRARVEALNAELREDLQRSIEAKLQAMQGQLPAQDGGSASSQDISSLRRDLSKARSDIRELQALPQTLRDLDDELRVLREELAALR